MVEFVLGDFAAKRVAMNAQDFCGAGLVAVGAFENALDEALFEFADSLVEEDAALDHQGNQAFQLISHGRSSATENNASSGLLVQFAAYQNAIGFAILRASRRDDIRR